MAIRTVYVDSKGKDNLARLKRYTRVRNWNTLCRWALCLSLSDENPPPPIKRDGESDGLMTWRVFGGQYKDLYLGLIKLRCKKEGLIMSDDVYAEQFRLHLHRGLARLAELDCIKIPNTKKLRSPRGLVELAINSLSICSVDKRRNSLF